MSHYKDRLSTILATKGENVSKCHQPQLRTRLDDEAAGPPGPGKSPPSLKPEETEARAQC